MSIVEENGVETINEPEKVETYIPPVPFSERIQKHKDDQQFKKFAKILKQLHINIPFVDVIT